MMSKIPTQEKTNRLLNIPEVARRWSVSEWTVRKWIQLGKVGSNKLGGRRLVPESEVERLINETAVPARAAAV
jgi:excisionase family DNA binding protein